MRGRWEVNNKQWAALEPILSSPQQEEGRERVSPSTSDDTRAVLNAVLWVLGTGARWQELPGRYPPHRTCHRRLQQWVKTGQFEHALRVLAGYLQQQGKLCVEEVSTEPDSSQRHAWQLVGREGKQRRYSPSPLLTVFLSPLGSKALARADLN